MQRVYTLQNLRICRIAAVRNLRHFGFSMAEKSKRVLRVQTALVRIETELKTIATYARKQHTARCGPREATP